MVTENPAPRRWTPAEIRNLRRRAGYSQELFARTLGVAASTVSKWENGRKRPQGLSLRALANLEDRLDRGSGSESEPIPIPFGRAHSYGSERFSLDPRPWRDWPLER